MSFLSIDARQEFVGVSDDWNIAIAIHMPAHIGSTDAAGSTVVSGALPKSSKPARNNYIG
jgi:hypothetical protein